MPALGALFVGEPHACGAVVGSSPFGRSMFSADSIVCGKDPVLFRCASELAKARLLSDAYTSWPVAEIALVLMGAVLAAGVGAGLCSLRRRLIARKRSPASMEQSGVFFQSVIDAVADPILVIALNYEVVLANRAARQTYGQEQMIGRKCYEVSHHSSRACGDSPECPCPLLKVVETRSPMTVTHIHTGPAGAEIIHEIVASPICDQAGQVVQIVQACRDITERLRSERERILLTAAIEQAGETVVITDGEGVIQYVNPAFERITGRTRSDAIGENMREFAGGCDSSYQQLWTAVTSGQVWRGHLTSRRPDGAVYQEEVTISPVRNASGSITNYVAVKHDMTRQAELEAQLRQSQKMDAIGQLAGGVAHEFNNILTAILINADRLRRGVRTESKHARIVEEIICSGRRAAELTSQLLTFARTKPLQLVPVDMHKVVADVVNLLGRTIDRRIAITQDLQAGQSTVLGDPNQLSSILLHLGLNARDAMSEGGEMAIATTVASLDERACASHEADIQPGQYLKICLSDTGEGMDRDTQAHIFEPFFTTREPGKGTGLGLADVYGCVRNCNGIINVQSELGVGTTVTVLLPLAPGRAALQQPPSPPSASSGQRQILLVDDDELILSSVGEVLGDLGFNVTTCDCGADALTYYRDHYQQVDLIILDLIMPEMDGRETFEKLKEINPRVRVLICSGYSQDPMSNQAGDENIVGFLAKPFEIDELAQTVVGYLEQSL